MVTETNAGNLQYYLNDAAEFRRLLAARDSIASVFDSDCQKRWEVVGRLAYVKDERCYEVLSVPVAQRAYSCKHMVTKNRRMCADARTDYLLSWKQEK